MAGGGAGFQVLPEAATHPTLKAPKKQNQKNRPAYPPFPFPTKGLETVVRRFIPLFPSRGFYTTRVIQ